MSKSNENNRAQAVLSIGAVAATLTMIVMIAHKKMRLRKVSIADTALVAASGSNYVEAQLKVNGTLVGTPVDTQLGLTAREVLDLVIHANGYLDIEAGDVVELVLTVNGTGALTHSAVSIDQEIIGN